MQTMQWESSSDNQEECKIWVHTRRRGIFDFIIRTQTCSKNQRDHSA